MESAIRRSISSSTCSTDKLSSIVSPERKRRDGIRARNVNEFLKEQRIKMEKILDGESSAKAKIVLSGPSSS